MAAKLIKPKTVRGVRKEMECNPGPGRQGCGARFSFVPRTTHVRLDLGTILHVLRTRVRPPDLYNRHARGWVLTLNTATGQEVYVQEKYLEPVE